MHSKSLFKPAQYLLPLALLLLQAVPLEAQSFQAARQGIIASLAARDQAYSTSNLIPFLQTYAPGWTVTNLSDRSSNFRTYSASIAQTFAYYPSGLKGGMASKLQSLSTGKFGVDAIVYTRSAYPKRRLKLGNYYYYSRSTTGDQIWAVSGGHWQELREKFLVDRVTYSLKPLPDDKSEPVTPANNISSSTESHDIATVLNARVDAYKHRNLAAYAQTLSINFTLTDVVGRTESYKQVIAAVGNTFAKHPAESGRGVVYKILSASSSKIGLDAVIRVRYVYPSKHTKTGTCYVYRTLINESSWAKSGRDWQEHSDHLIYEQSIYSSKPIAQ